MENNKNAYTGNDIQKLLSCHPQNRDHFSSLIRFMHKHVVVPFIGAGFSKNYGYPGWDEFLRAQAKENCIDEIPGLLDSHEYEKAASKLYNRFDKSTEFVLMQSFGDHIYKNSAEVPELELISKIFNNLLLTTNFDEVIELIYAKVNGEYIEKLTPMTVSNTKVIQKRIACGEPTLIKLHGDVATREFVLDEQEYDATYGVRVLDAQLPLPRFLHDVLLSKIVLFLGCSLMDDRTLQVIKKSQIEGSMSFALLQLPSETENAEDPWSPKLKNSNNKTENEALAKRQAFMNEHNIIPIWYPYGKHESLKIFLMALSERVNSEYSVTVAHNTLKSLLYDGMAYNKNGDIAQAFQCFAEAEKVLDKNYGAFTERDHINSLWRIKDFYDSNGYAIERRSIMKKLIHLTKQATPYNGLDVAMCYHSLGYTFERYQYYSMLLKAMIRSKEILENTKSDSIIDFNNTAALIYTSLAYAYYNNGNYEDAIVWYKKVEKLCNEPNINKKSRAFMLNGLYRYYDLLGDINKAVSTLDNALQLRRELIASEDEAKWDLPKHVVNSHSNKMRIYMKAGLYENAMDEYTACMNEDNINEQLSNLPDTKQRILEDYGDVVYQMELKGVNGDHDAYSIYKESLKYRRYLHIATDIISARLYEKIANCLERKNRLEEALEYMIQSYVIQKKKLGQHHGKLMDLKTRIDECAEKLSYDTNLVERRIEIQSDFLELKSDEQINELEDKLIKEFEL